MSTVRFTVDGMSCGHCAASVREGVGTIPDVNSVDVDVATGQVALDASGPVARDAIKRAVEEAGYRLGG